MFGEQLYMHQFKINAKSAFDGEVWQWHQDYGTWARDDGMPEPRAMNISVFVDEVMHDQRATDAGAAQPHATACWTRRTICRTTSYPLWTLDNDTVTRLVDEGGIVAPIGKPGGVLMFHGNLVHGSAGNITPYPAQDRVSDAERGFQLHPHADASRLDRAPRLPPIEPVADDALLRHARSFQAAAE